MAQEQPLTGHQTKLEPTPKFHHLKQLTVFYNKDRNLSTLVSIPQCHNQIHVKKVREKVQGVPQSQTAALPRPQEEEETDKSKQAQTEQTYEEH